MKIKSKHTSKKNRVVKLPKPNKNVSLRKYGYTTKKSSIAREKALKKASKEIGTLPIMRRLTLIANLNRNNEKLHDTMREDVEYLKLQYAREKKRNSKKPKKN